MRLKNNSILILLATLCLFFHVSKAGPIAYGVCQTGCNGLAVACYGAAGYTFGTVTAGVGIPVAIVQCNAALGACMGACVAAGLIPLF
ncbi:MAG: hypothetical protein EXX96DRAFT_517501 [Benjaminiella poitrasii]|nr:MAG: hypothetical protein EXX96DRAFT_517501 [Benjaminiella poitrasii]